MNSSFHHKASRKGSSTRARGDPAVTSATNDQDLRHHRPRARFDEKSGADRDSYRRLRIRDYVAETALTSTRMGSRHSSDDDNFSVLPLNTISREETRRSRPRSASLSFDVQRLCENSITGRSGLTKGDKVRHRS